MASRRNRAVSRSAMLDPLGGPDGGVVDRDLELEEGAPGLRGLEEARRGHVLRREGRGAGRKPVLPRVAHHPIGGLQLGAGQPDVGPRQQPGVAGRRHRRLQLGIAVRIEGTVGEDGHAQGLLGLAHEQLRELEAPLGGGELLGRAHVVEPAALAGFQAGPGVVLEGPRRVQVADRDLALALARR